MRKNNRVQIGRTIGERREHLETASERLAARKKGKKKQFWRVFLTMILFLAVFGGVVYGGIVFFNREETEVIPEAEMIYSSPKIPVVDEDAELTGAELNLTSRMSTWIAQAEHEFIVETGYTPVRAVIPSGAIREVDFYFEEFSGYVKTTIDRGVGVSVEDFSRMMQYLSEKGVADFTYIDVRVEGKGYWK